VCRLEPDAIPISERIAPNPINPYGFTKLVCEHMMDDFGREMWGWAPQHSDLAAIITDAWRWHNKSAIGIPRRPTSQAPEAEEAQIP
jgi:UDP-glucose 4-epimerase